ncbi:MAG TPA: hypothetical protein DFR83_15100, partial [Deltaproteobacteria bacterium]|nr:hypothetical protein [Deltaproteobacteria bacterium]
MGNDSALLLGMALTGCALVRIDPEIEAQFEAAKTEATVQANAIRPHIEADLNALSAYPWMADRTCVRDASEVLHPLFGFEDNTYIDQGLLPPPSHRGPAAKALRKAAEKWRSAPEGAHWMTQGADPEVQAQTLPWVTALRDFDCWDITAHSPWDQVDPVALDFFPNPGGQTLFAASMLLLMQLHVPLDHPTQSDSERIQQTLADVRRLATLCIQSQEFITARIGANILQREREAVEHLTAQGRAPVEWHVVPKADNDRLYRLLTASPAFANFFTPLKHREL